MKITTFLMVIALYAFPNILCGQISEDSIKSTLNTFNQGLKEKNTELVQNSFAPNFSLSTSSWPNAKSLLDIIMKNVNFESISYCSIEKQDENITLVKTKFILQDKKEHESLIAFNSDNKILYVDYFDRLFGQSRYRESRLAGVLPFTQDEESIILKIKLNDSNRVLSFLLDTGADGMAIRKALADSLNLNISHTQNANIVGGQTQVTISSGNTVHLSDSLTLKNQNMAIFEKVRSNCDGIIGLNLVKQYITNIDFDKQQISFYTFGNYKYQDEGKTISVSMPYNLILIPGNLNLTGKKTVTGNFLMDTGANYHLIGFSRFVRKNRLLLSGFKPESEGSTVSLGHATPVFNGKAHEFAIGDAIVLNDMPITLQASGSSESTRKDIPDGSIGIQLFSKYNFTIDLLRKEIHLAPRK
ncbi:MAG: retropepsin-like aspartic protease [Dysgonomonas sp.]|nr:retropepsin-like aspartic protease [Dysgonomonas sp.]